MANRSVIITGAAEGIGAACAERFTQEGDNVILVDKDEEAGKELAERLKNETGDNVTFVHADMSSRLHIHNVIAEALESFEKIDVLVHAAVTHYSAPFLETSEEDFQDVISQNLIGAFLINQAVAKQFIKQIDEVEPTERGFVKHQAIVNIGSVEGVTTQSDHIAFAASQGGLHQMSKGIALSLSPYGIRVNTIGAGPIRGEGEAVKHRGKITPLNRLGEPEDAANVAWFLTSEQASFVTGQTIFVDGGQLVKNHQQPEADNNA